MSDSRSILVFVFNKKPAACFRLGDQLPYGANVADESIIDDFCPTGFLQVIWGGELAMGHRAKDPDVENLNEASIVPRRQQVASAFNSGAFCGSRRLVVASGMKFATEFLPALP